MLHQFSIKNSLRSPNNEEKTVIKIFKRLLYNFGLIKKLFEPVHKSLKTSKLR